MSWRILRPQIKELLETSTLLQEVSQSPKIDFNGYPSAHIIPSENSSDYETNRENIRVYAFSIRVFHETQTQGIENALLALEEVVDDLIDLFDKEDLKGSDTRIVGKNLPNDYMYINMFATPNRWGELPELNMIMTEITVRIRISIDVS